MDSPTSRPRRLAPAASLTVAGLVVAAAGIVIQIASGADYPTVPPGPDHPAGRRRPGRPGDPLALDDHRRGDRVAVPPRRRHPRSQAREQLSDPTQVGIVIGTVIQLLALVVALVAGVAATRHFYRTQTRA
jgi:hypothetical protein